MINYRHKAQFQVGITWLNNHIVLPISQAGVAENVPGDKVCNWNEQRQPTCPSLEVAPHCATFP
jgi:hypothetical protein